MTILSKNFKTFNEFMLGEGLIKIPLDLYRSMLSYILSQYISYINNYDKEIANKLQKKYGVQIDTSFKPVNKEIELNTTLDGLPQKIKDNWKLEFGYIKLIIDWEYKIWGLRPKVNASYEESSSNGIPGYFTINPRKLIDLLQTSYNINDIEDILTTLKTTVYHEITHAVQHNSLKWLDKNQVGKSRIIRDNPLSSKEDRRIEYLSAEVELDPTIKSKITQFQKKYSGKDLQKSLAIFVGAIQMEGETGDEFFLALKKTNMKQWKRAVKKFYLNYDLNIELLLNTIPN